MRLWIAILMATNLLSTLPTGQAIGPVAEMVFNGGSPLTAYRYVRFETNEAEAADFAIAAQQHAGANGQTRCDNALSFGYNYSASGGKQVSAEHQFGHCIESFYRTAEGNDQLEMYYAWTSANGSVSFRPFSQTINITNNDCEIGLRGDRLRIGDKTNTLDWVNFASTSSEGVLAFTGNCYLNYSGSVRDYFVKSGSGILGSDALGARLAAGYGVASICAAQNYQGDDSVLQFGGSGSGNPQTLGNGAAIRWLGSASGQGRQFQVNKINGSGSPVWDYLTVANVAQYGICTGTLGATSGNYTAIGYVTANSTYSCLAKIDVVISENCVQSYIIPRDENDMGNTNWYQALPLVSHNQASVALDVRKGTSDRMEIRLRRTASAGSATTMQVYVQTQARESFVESQSTGTGATVSGIYRGTALTQVSGKVGVNIAAPAYDLDVAGTLGVSGNVDLSGLPTSDPAVAGRLWRSGNDVKVSTG